MIFQMDDKFADIQAQFACAVPVKKIRWQVRLYARGKREMFRKL